MGVTERTNTPLAASGNWSTGWVASSNDKGEALFVLVSSYSDQPGTVQILETDDPTNVSLTSTTRIAAANGGKLFQFDQGITRSFYQVTYTNGPANAQTTFEIAVSTVQANGLLRELQRVNFYLAALNGNKPLLPKDDPYDPTFAPFQ